VKFIVDAQLPPALARLLRESGCDASAVREIGLREATTPKSGGTRFNSKQPSLQKD
jgi:predicted nuclease of predicted toxin-antitoxin system